MTQAPLSQLEQALQHYRNALLRRDSAILALLTQRWRVIQRMLWDDIDILMAKIEQATAQGKPVKPSWLRQQRRYQELLEQIEELTRTFAVDLEPMIRAGQETAAAMAVEHARGLTIAQLGERVTWNLLPVAQTNEMIGLLSDGSPLADYLKQFGKVAAKSAEETLLHGVAVGQGPREIARELGKIFGVRTAADPGAIARKAMMTSRQSILGVYRNVSLQSYRENRDTVKKWRWHCARSVRTCGACWAMDGQEFDLDVSFASHISCRCTCIPVTASWSELGLSVPETQPRIETGPEVFAKLPEADQLRILGPGKLQRFRAGMPLSALVAETHSAKWGPGRREKTLREVTA